MGSVMPNVVAIVELLLTTEIYNRSDNLNANDLPLRFRRHYFDGGVMDVVRPLLVMESDLERICPLDDEMLRALEDLPFLGFDDTDGELAITDFDAAAKWFAGRDQFYEAMDRNPTLAYYYQKFDPSVSYIEARVAINKENLALDTSRNGIDIKIEELNATEKDAEDILKLVTIKVPEDVRNRLDDLVLTEDQRKEIAKAGKALEHRDYLGQVGLLEIGKILFVGPPGTGKTTAARALSNWFGLPLVEVNLSMIISHYLGKTSKNIDRVFMLAKRLSPCILFIDEFDFVAKARTSEDHGAMKRAVNTLLKAVDEISLIEHGVLLIAATNHPQLLDYAAWRRFDKVLSFNAPDDEMRVRILQKILERANATVDYEELARLTEGYTGSDLRLVVREAVLNALLEDRRKIDQNDLLQAVAEFERRIADHKNGETS